MTNEEKRRDAAFTLSVPYDATPDMVAAAYNRRLSQRLPLNFTDDETLLRGNIELYDAKVRMQYSPSQQWRANLKLGMQSDNDKIHDVLMDNMYCIIRKVSDMQLPLHSIIFTEIAKASHKLYQKYKLSCNLLKYNLTVLGGMFVYNQTDHTNNIIIPMAAYGSILVATVVFAWTQDAQHKHLRDIHFWQRALRELNQNHK